MRVSNGYLKNVKVGPPELPVDGTSGNRAVEAPAVISASSFISSPELQTYLSQLAQQPVLRRDKLRAVAKRLADGELLSAEAARDTAAAILDAEG